MISPPFTRRREALEDAKVAIEAATASMVFEGPTQKFLYRTHDKIVAALEPPFTRDEISLILIAVCGSGLLGMLLAGVSQ
jgi:hypothetical protein